MAENLKGRFWWGMCDNNDEKIQNGAVCAGENKKRESNSQRLREQQKKWNKSNRKMKEKNNIRFEIRRN